MSRRKLYWLKLSRQQNRNPDLPGHTIRGTGETRVNEEGNGGKLRGVGHVGTVPMKTRKQELVAKWCR